MRRVQEADEAPDYKRAVRHTIVMCKDDSLLSYEIPIYLLKLDPTLKRARYALHSAHIGEKGSRGANSP